MSAAASFVVVMTKALITVRVGATVTHFHDPSLSERWVANLMSASTPCGAGGKDKDELGTRTLVGQKKTQSAKNATVTPALLQSTLKTLVGNASCGECLAFNAESADKEASASTSARLASSLEVPVGSYFASSTVSSRTGKCPATKPVEEETMLSTPSSVRPARARKHNRELSEVKGLMDELLNSSAESIGMKQVDEIEEADFAFWGGPFCGECGAKVAACTC